MLAAAYCNLLRSFTILLRPGLKKSLYNIGMILSLKIWQNLTMKQLDGMCVYGFMCVCSSPRQNLSYRLHFFSGYACAVCSVVSDSVTPWTLTLQAPQSMGFSRQEYWNGLPFPSPLVVIGLFRFPMLLWNTFEKFCFSRKLSLSFMFKW